LVIYLARFIIELATPLHCGGGEDLLMDQPVDRDVFGFYRLPGTSLAGICRAKAAEWAGPGGQAASEVNQAFGFITQGQNESKSSFIWFRDGRLLDFSGAFADEVFWRERKSSLPLGPFLRDHVRIDFETGAGVKGGKFDEEYAPAGLRFALEFCLDGWNGEPSAATLTIFRRLGWAIKSGEIRFGGKAAEGFGRIKTIEADCRRFDLYTEEGLQDWLNLSPGPRFQPAEGQKVEFLEPPAQVSVGLAGSLVFPVEAQGPLLIGGGAAPTSSKAAAEADVVFYKEPFYNYAQSNVEWGFVLPGSSLRGVVRHRVYLIAASLFSEPRAEELVNSIFGLAQGGKSQRGKIFFEDVRIPKSQEILVPHVAIDRFSGGVLESALYFEAPLWDKGLSFEVKIHFESLSDLEAAILAQAFLDLLEGKLPVGAGNNRGNGYLRLRGGYETTRLKTIGGEIRWGEEMLSSERLDFAATWLTRMDEALASQPTE
jgi:CRISPR/Cas system CMR subunit Cmr4 (Cas7 group RAMP superfamily)